MSLIACCRDVITTAKPYCRDKKNHTGRQATVSYYVKYVILVKSAHCYANRIEYR